MKRRLPLAQRFWVKVQITDGCWIWLAGKSKGYGVIGLGGKGNPAYAHRVSWELHYGPIQKHMDVLHRCDNPPCVRPDHLFLGTQGDNNRDRHAKGRDGSTTRGRPNHRRLLSDEQVDFIRASGDRRSVLARQMGVSIACVGRICRGEMYNIPNPR
jgi:hypothetical protein